MPDHGRGPGWIALGAALLLGAAAALSGCAAQVHTPRPLTAEVREQTFDRYWVELARHYPFFDRAGVDWAAERARWREAAINAPTAAEFYAALASMLSALGDPHVSLRPAPGALAEADGAAHPTVPEIALTWVAGRAYVRRWPADAVVIGPPGDAASAAALDDNGYPELTAIAGVRPHRNMVPLMLSGPEGTHVDVAAAWTGGQERLVRLTRPPGVLGGNATSGVAGWPLTVHPAQMAGTVLEHPGTLRREIEIHWDDGTVSWMDFAGGGAVPGEAQAAGEGTAAAGDPVSAAAHAPSVIDAALRSDRAAVAAVTRRSWGEWLTSVDLGGAAYLRVSTLDHEEAGGGMPMGEMIDAFDAAVSGVLDAPALIIDLRYNGGGRPQSLAAMVGRFIDRPVELSSPQRRFAGIWPYRYAARIEPRPPIYRGRLAILINHETGSAAEHWAALLQRTGRAIVVGERSTGAEALVEIIRGPDGSELRYGWLRFVDERGGGIQGVGVTPDVGVPLTIARIREIGYAAAVAEVERRQFIEACRALGVDAAAVGITPLPPPPRSSQ